VPLPVGTTSTASSSSSSESVPGAGARAIVKFATCSSGFHKTLKGRSPAQQRPGPPGRRPSSQRDWEVACRSGSSIVRIASSKRPGASCPSSHTDPGQKLQVDITTSKRAIDHDAHLQACTLRVEYSRCHSRANHQRRGRPLARRCVASS
jgi:hypothetical protein